MIRLSSEMERGAREAHFAFGCTVYAVGEYMQWLLRGVAKKPDTCHLVVVGPDDELRKYRADALKLGAKINPDGTVQHNNTHFTFQTSLTVIPALDIFRDQIVTARTYSNDTLKVFVDDKFIRNLTHFDSTSEALQKRVNRELDNLGGTVTIRETVDGPVLHTWTKDGPPEKAPVRTLSVYLNDAKAPKQVPWTTSHAAIEAALGAVRGDFIRPEADLAPWLVGGVYSVGVQRGDRNARVFFPVGSLIDCYKLAEAVGAGPGDSFSWAKRADGNWVMHTMPRLPGEAKFQARWYGSGNIVEFTAPAKDATDDVLYAKAYEALKGVLMPPCALGDIMVERVTGSGVFSRLMPSVKPQDVTAYTANYNGHLSSARGFLSSKKDKAKVREDALKALGKRFGDARLFIRANGDDGAFPQHYTEC